MTDKILTIALISSHAPSLDYFRGPLIRALSQRGFRVLALAPNYNEFVRAAVVGWGGVPIDCKMSRAGMNPFRDVFNTWILSRTLRQLAPDITLGYFIKPVIFGTLAAWWAGVPSRFAMIEGLGYVFTSGADRLSIKRLVLKYVVMGLYKVALARAQLVLFLNPDDLNEFVDANLLPLEKCRRIGGIGVDLGAWSVAPSVECPITFLLIARLLREKGIAEFAGAARIVKKLHPDVRFILLGAVDENPGAITADEVGAWVSEGLLEWHGHVPVKAWLNASSVYVLPSYREGVPVSTQEALAVGRPVITTDVPGCRETVVDGLNGFLVPPRSAGELAKKMLLFIEQPDLISSMGNESRKLAEEKFDVHRINSKLIDILLNQTSYSRNAQS